MGFKSTFKAKTRLAIIMLSFHATWNKAHLYATLTLRSVDEILWCYHSNETSSAVLSCNTIKTNFWLRGWNPMVLPFKWNLFSSSFTRYYLLSNYVVLTFVSVNEILCCYHSNETYLAVLCIVLFIFGILEKKTWVFFWILSLVTCWNSQ